MIITEEGRHSSVEKREKGTKEDFHSNWKGKEKKVWAGQGKQESMESKIVKGPKGEERTEGE